MNILSKMTENRFYLTTNSIFSLMNFSHIKEFQVLSFFSYCPYFLDDPPPPPHEPSLSDNLSDREFLERIVRIWNYLLNSKKEEIWHRCFPVNFAKFLRTLFFTEHLWWLLLTYFMKKLNFQ